MLAVLCEHSCWQQCVPFVACTICEHLRILCERSPRCSCASRAFLHPYSFAQKFSKGHEVFFFFLFEAPDTYERAEFKHDQVRHRLHALTQNLHHIQMVSFPAKCISISSNSHFESCFPIRQERDFRFWYNTRIAIFGWFWGSLLAKSLESSWTSVR